MGIKCGISLNKPMDGFYRPGNKISGYVKYSLTKEMQFISIRIALKGRSECSWIENCRSKNRIQSRVEANEQIIDVDKNILANASGFLSPGVYTGNFNFQLPESIPPTFNYYDCSCRASISYFLCVKFTFASSFRLPSVLNYDIIIANRIKPTLPLEPITHGLQDELKRKFGFVSYSLNADLKVTISKSFLAPNENAELCVEVTNNTKYRVSKLKIALVKILTLKDNCGRFKNIIKEIEESRVKTVKIKEYYKCLYRSIVLPIGLNTLQGSRIIARDYKIVVTLSIPGIKYKAHLDVPIQVGQILSTEERMPQTNQETEIPYDLNNNVLASTTNLVYNNYYVTSQNVIPGSSAADEEDPPTYWDVMGEDKR